MPLPRMSRRGFGAAALAAAAYPVLGGPVPAFAEDAQAKGGERYHAPAEWEPHSACVMAWPWDRNVGWGPLLDEVQGEWPASPAPSPATKRS